MGRVQKTLAVLGVLATLTPPIASVSGAGAARHSESAAKAGERDRGEPDRLASRVVRALESGDAARLGHLFPSDRKIKASLSRIADLQGFVGSGPLVEALRRYLASRSDLRFVAEATGGEDRSEPVQIRGVLSSRDSAGRRERVGLIFVFDRLQEDWRAVEIRETG